MKEHIKDMVNKTCKTGTDELHNSYIVIFQGHEGLDSIKVSVKQDANRPNNQDDNEVVSDYILNNYGYRDYEIISLDLIESVAL